MTKPTLLGTQPQCRQCGATELDNLGPIPPAGIFAGQALEPPWDGGALLQCRRCHLAIRHPIKTESEYETLYTQASAKIWVSDALRTDQKQVLATIESVCPTGKVLDVGCYDGMLLASLGPRYGKYGVEASAAACNEARKKGVEIVAARIRDLPSIAMQFDVICAVDVIEHVENPQSFVTVLADHLAPGGVLIISTGTLDALPWRFVGGLYWYCGFPEHISFITQQWARVVAEQLGLDIAALHRFAYCELNGRSLVRARQRFFRKVLGDRLRALLTAWWPVGAPTHRPRHSRGAPGVFKDHMIVSFRKRDTSTKTNARDV